MKPTERIDATDEPKEDRLDACEHQLSFMFILKVAIFWKW